MKANARGVDLLLYGFDYVLHLMCARWVRKVAARCWFRQVDRHAPVLWTSDVTRTRQRIISRHSFRLDEIDQARTIMLSFTTSLRETTCTFVCFNDDANIPVDIENYRTDYFHQHTLN